MFSTWGQKPEDVIASYMMVQLCQCCKEYVYVYVEDKANFHTMRQIFRWYLIVGLYY